MAGERNWGGALQRARAFAAKDYALAAGLFVLVWAMLSTPWLSGRVTIPYDAKALFQAQLQFLANALHSGQSPFWNPSSFVGVPQIADPQSLIFSPAILLAYFERIPSFRELDAYVLLLLGLGGLAMLKFAQDRGWHPAGGVVAAIVFAFGASAAWRIQHIAQIQSLVFFALALWLLGRALDRASILYGVLAGLATGAMVLKPDQVALLGCYLLAGYCLAHWLLAPDKLGAVRRSLLPLATCSLFAVVLAALPVLLTYLFVEESNRPAIDFEEAVRGSLHPASLLTTVVANLYGVTDPAVDYWGPYSVWWDRDELTLSQNSGQIYFGVLPILLLLTAGLRRGVLWAREVRFFSVAIVLLLLYALGGYTPAFGVFYDYLPGVALFRRPVDATFPLGAMLAVVGGYLVHLWATSAIPHASLRRQGLEIGIVLAIVATGLGVAVAVGKVSVAWKPLLVALVWIGLAGLLLAAPKAWLGRGRRFAIMAPALLMASDLALNNGPNESTAQPASHFSVLQPGCRNDTIGYLKTHLRRDPGSQWRDRIEVVGLGFDWQNAAMVHGFEGTLGYNPFRLGEVSDATGARDYIAGADQKQFSPLFRSYASTMANLLGLRFIVVGVPVEQIDKSLKPGDLTLVAHTLDAYVYENPNVVPRVVFVGEWRVADFNTLTETGVWPQFDPLQTVLLDEPPEPNDIIPKLAREPTETSSVRIVRYENTRVVIEVEAAQAGFVVLHDVWHPWWSADLDGMDVPILRGNVLFRAVQVPAGRHLLTFEFEPISGALSDVSERFFRRTP